MPILIRLVVALSLLSALSSVIAQEWPRGPVALVIPFPPGGTTDVIARRVAQRLSDNLGQPVRVDNRPGASGAVGAAFVSGAAPDGHTLLFAPAQALVLAPAFSTAQYDAVRDFTPVYMVGFSPLVLAVHPSLGNGGLTEFLRRAKEDQKRVRFGHPGEGTMPHAAVLYLTQVSGSTFDLVAYKGGAPLLNDLLSGQVDAAFVDLSAVQPHVAASRLRALGTTSTAERNMTTIAGEPIPSIGATALPTYRAENWLGVVAPKGMPTSLVEKIESEIRRAVLSPDMADQLGSLGIALVSQSRAAFAQRLQDEVTLWRRVASTATSGHGGAATARTGQSPPSARRDAAPEEQPVSEYVATARKKSSALSATQRKSNRQLLSSAFELFKAGDLAGAKIGFLRGIEADPAEAAAHYYLAETLSRQGETGRARRHYEIAQTLNPNSPEGLRAAAALERR